MCPGSAWAAGYRHAMGQREAEPWPQVGPPGVRAAGGFSFTEVRHRDKGKLKNYLIMKLCCPGRGPEQREEVSQAGREGGRKRTGGDGTEKTQRSHCQLSVPGQVPLPL